MRVIVLLLMLGWMVIGCDGKRLQEPDGGWFGDVELDSLRPDSGVPFRPQAGRGGGTPPQRDREDGGVAGRGSVGSAGGSAAGTGGGGSGGRAAAGTTAGTAGSVGTSQTSSAQALEYGSLVITEFMADPDARSDAQGEWFELYNTTSEDIELTRCTVGAGDGKPRALADAGSIEARGYASIAGTADAGFDADVVSSLSLKNGAGVIEVHCGGVLIDRVAYDKAQGFPIAAGVAAALDPMRIDADQNDEASAWCRAATAYASDRGTPGRANPACGAGAPADGGPAVPMEDEPADGPSAPPTAVAPEVSYGAIVITEIMADPKAVNDAQGEWFEVYNTTSEAIDLAGCTIDDGATHPIDAALQVPADGYATFASTDDPGFAPTRSGALSLTNGADVIELRCGDTLVDRVAYDKAAGFPLAAGAAAMLAPSKLDADANDESSNWCLAGSAFGDDFGTPGRSNGACGSSAAMSQDEPDAPEEAPEMDAEAPPAVPPEESRAALPYGAVVITELMADPDAADDADAEWVELHNATEGVIDLTGCTIGDDSGEPHVIDETVTLDSFEYITIASSAAPGFSPTYVTSLSLTNAADVIELRCGGEVVDRVAYDAAVGFPITAGVAAMLDPAQLDADQNDSSDAWCGATTEYAGDRGTPGRANDVCVRESPDGSVPESDTEAATESEPPPPSNPLAYGAIVITELMADPEARPDAEGEWLELYNATSDVIDLQGCTIGDGSAEPPAFAESFTIAAGDYATLASGSAPGFSPTFVSSLSLTNAADLIELRCAGELVDQVAYDQAAGFPLTAGKASMLDPSRLDADRNDDPSAWCAATTEYDVDRGTPGRPNDPCAEAQPEAPPPPPTLSYGAVVITEFMADPQALSDSDGEWLELYNATADPVDLTGCTITGGGTGPQDIVEPFQIGAGEYATVARASGPGFTPGLVSSLSLANDAGVIELSCGGVLVDAVVYDATQGFPLTPGAAAMLDPGQLDADSNDLPSAWCESASEFATDLGTPGAANPACARVDETDAGLFVGP